VTEEPREKYGTALQQKVGRSLGKVYGEGFSVHVGYSDRFPVHLVVETDNLGMRLETR